MKITFLWVILLSASVACAGDDSKIDHKYPAGSPEWRSVLHKKIAQLERERSSLLTVKNGELYEDAERRYKRAEGMQNRINKLSTMLADNSESSVQRGRKPSRKSPAAPDVEAVDFSHLSNPDKHVATARPVTDSAAPPVDPSERRGRMLKKAERLAEERNDLLTPSPGESKKQASIRHEDAQRKLNKINKIKSEMDK